MRRKMLHFILGLIAAALPFAVSMPQAHADGGTTLLSLVNSLRATHGAAPLAVDPLLTSVAQQWSAHMAAAGGLSHNLSLASIVPTGWTRIGENVGTGGSLSAVYNALVTSPPHFANMIDPAFNLTGVAVVRAANGTLWVTEDFETRPGATPNPIPTPPPTVAPAPVTVPRPVAAVPRPPSIAAPAAPATRVGTPAPPAPPSAAATAPSTSAPPTLAAAAASADQISPPADPAPSGPSGHQLRAIATTAAHGHPATRSGWLIAGTGIGALCLFSVALAAVGRVRFGWS